MNAMKTPRTRRKKTADAGADDPAVVERACARIHLVTTVRGKGRVFIKMDTFKLGGREDLSREKAAYRLLAGLGIPTEIELSRTERKRLLGSIPGDLLCVEYSGERFGCYPLTDDQTIGVWAFVGEQLAAMTQRGVLYSDVKYENVVMNERASQVRVIDLEGCTPHRADNRYGVLAAKSTRQFAAPEHQQALDLGRLEQTVSEAAIVYQWGMLLVSVLGKDLDQGRLTEQTQARVQQALSRKGARKVTTLLRRVLSTDPARRPQSFVTLVPLIRAAIDGDGLTEAMRVWRRLRQPLAGALDECGLGATP